MNRFTPLVLAVSLAAAPLLAAGEHPPSQADVEILPGWRTEAGTHIAALRVTLGESWKTYWRAPGEAGLPPRLDWSGSENVASVTPHWPVPEAFLSSGMMTLGYHDELILPLEIVPVDSKADIALVGDLTMGICENICVPIEADVTATLPSTGGRHDPRIQLSLDRQPESAATAGLVAAHCDLVEIEDGLTVTARLLMPAIGSDEIAVIEAADPSIWVSSVTSTREGDALIAVADLVPANAKPFALDPATLRFTVLAGERAVDIRGCAAQP
jgi:DsbC/DsbD-like thiol-disulfide interchange protein